MTQTLDINSTSSSNSNVLTHIPSGTVDAVFCKSMDLPEDTPICKGMDFNDYIVLHNNNNNNNNNNSDTDATKNKEKKNLDTNSFLLDGIMNAMRTTGFQATNVALAVDQIRAMRAWRLSHVLEKKEIEPQEDAIRAKVRARIFLAYTSNQISCGQREILRFLVQHSMVDVIVSTAGGIEEDLIKCMGDTYIGDFKLAGKELRKRGINRIGNLLMPNHNYVVFEDWMTPIIQKMHEEQMEQDQEWAKQLMQAHQDHQNNMNKRKNPATNHHHFMDIPERFVWTPSKIIHRLGLEINNEDSVLYWAAKNNIPIFCPALTDGSIGDMFYFHSYKEKGFVIDINEDIRRLNDLAIQSHCTGQIIIGGGVVKHHTCNANLMRNGADYSVYINTGQEFDGSDSGASPDEAVSWGKIRLTANPVKVCADATIVWPLIVSQTFAKNVAQWKEESKDCVCWM